MALLGKRYEFQTDVSFFMNEVAERGGCVSFSTGNPSGEAMDSSTNVVTYVANPSGKVPIGILLNDMVDVDITRHKVNPYKNEVQKGGKVTILRKGWVITDMIHSTGTPGAGSGLYLADSGLFSTSTRALALNSGATPIGKFLSAKDSNGYAKVEINLP